MNIRLIFIVCIKSMQENRKSTDQRINNYSWWNDTIVAFSLIIRPFHVYKISEWSTDENLATSQ